MGDRRESRSSVTICIPSIMEPLDCPSLQLMPEVEAERLFSLSLNEDSLDNSHSFLLLDESERMRVSSPEQFLEKLRLPADSQTRAKVVSIFGNSGDGKSHTLNHTFFDGSEVFRTSSEQNSCTFGVWAAFDAAGKVICLDTEGMLGVTARENQRMRLLLKVLAVSDIVIFRTRSERLHRDLYTFLGSASRAYSQHFHAALNDVGQRSEFSGPVSALGPSVIIFHETRHTQTLHSSVSESAEDIIRERFGSMKLEIDAFSSIRYIGVQTKSPPTSFNELKSAALLELENSAVRSPRNPKVVYEALKALNDKFSGEIDNSAPPLFPDQYFTCPAKCLSCGDGCQRSMGHLREDVQHSASSNCKYQHQYQNCVFICKTCYNNGKEVIVRQRVQATNDNALYNIALYAWSGYVIECPNCGEIYRSRQYWYGNKSPEDVAVRKEIVHVWPGMLTGKESQYSAQKVIDGVSYLTETVVSASQQPTKVISSWVTDQIAPKYWRPNHEIKFCHACKKPFGPLDKKHHCRSCGEGFCDECSANEQLVPSRGWHVKVRVCDNCATPAKVPKPQPQVARRRPDEDEADVQMRQYSEMLGSTVSKVVSMLEYPKDRIKDLARPDYWVPDSEISQCSCCGCDFGPVVPLHHCRECGKGVCDSCSQSRKPVPFRGWHSPTRVCDQCVKLD